MNKAVLAIASILLAACAAQPQPTIASTAPSRASLPAPNFPAPMVIEPAAPVRSGTMLLPGTY